MVDTEKEVKRLVFNRFMAFKNGEFCFGPNLELLIKQKSISPEDAIKIILELMYDVVNYNFNNNDVVEEFKSLVEKVSEYNLNMQGTVKNAVLFFKDYSYEIELFTRFSSNLKISEKYKNDISFVFDDIKSKKDNDDSIKVDAIPYQNSNNSSKDNKNTAISLYIREKMQLDKEIRDLSKDLRKHHPRNWRELLKETEVYKKRHGLDTQEEMNKKPTDTDIKKLKVRSDYLSNKLESTIKSYSDFIYKLINLMEGFSDDELNQTLQHLTLIRNELSDYKKLCQNFERLDEISEKIKKADNDLNTIKQDNQHILYGISTVELKILHEQYNEYSRLMKKANSLAETNFTFYSKLKSKLKELINNVEKIRNPSDKKELFDNLNKLNAENNRISDHLIEINDTLTNKDFKYFTSLEQVNDETILLNILMEELNQLPYENLEKKIIIQEKHYHELYEKEQKKLKIRSDYLLNKIKYSIKSYDSLIMEINSELEKFPNDNELNQMHEQLKSTYNNLKEYQDYCNDYNVLDSISEKIKTADNELKHLISNFKQNALERRLSQLRILEDKFDEYSDLRDKVRYLLDNRLIFFSEFDSKLDNLIDDSAKLSIHINKKELSSNLEQLKNECLVISNNLETIKNVIISKDITSFVSIGQANTEMMALNGFFDELSQISLEYFDEKLIELEKVYQRLLSQSNKIMSGNVEGLLEECNKYFKRPMFKRQLKKYNLGDDELDIIKKDIQNDIINYVIVEGDDLKDIIKTRCQEFRKDNPEFGEKEIDDLLNSLTFPDIDSKVVNESKNQVKMDYLNGDITFNQVELKLNNYINKKLRESDQLNELERIRNNPRVPAIKVHLTQEENDEIYVITKQEITSDYGINGTVVNRVYFWMNKKIRENQSEARGRLNIIKREFSTLTNLDENQQNEFIHQIEFNINDNKIKYYEITEEYIVELSENFINYGKLEL